MSQGRRGTATRFNLLDSALSKITPAEKQLASAGVDFFTMCARTNGSFYVCKEIKLTEPAFVPSGGRETAR